MSDKKVKLRGVTLTKETAENVVAMYQEAIDEIQAQLDAPEPVEFWEGQLVVNVNNGRLDRWRPSKMGVDAWEPLQDPLILQFRAHVPGDPMPCHKKDRVTFMRRDGVICQRVLAINTGWHYKDENHFDVIGWMPADGWGGGR